VSEQAGKQLSMATIKPSGDHTFNPADWEGPCAGNEHAIADAAIFLTSLILDALKDASAPPHLHRAAEGLWAQRGKIAGAICTGLMSLTPPLYSAASDERAGTLLRNGELDVGANFSSRYNRT